MSNAPDVMVGTSLARDSTLTPTSAKPALSLKSMFNIRRNSPMIYSRAALVFAALSTAIACGNTSTTASPSFSDYGNAREIIAGLADEVIVPTYELLAARLAELDSAVQSLAADRTQESLVSAQEAWVAAREPWEASEGFIFGPVDAFGFDPALDSWPVDLTSLDLILASPDAFSPEYVSNLEDSVQGFHTAEYVLFGADSDTTIDDLSDREIEYLSAVVAEMAAVGDELADAWTDGVDGQTAYVTNFRDAGAATNTFYPSLEAAGQEIIFGSIGILDEVADGKIADPFDEQDATLVESRCSLNSIDDFSNNMRSVQNAYLGRNVMTGEFAAHAFSEYFASVDEALDARVQAELQSAIDAVDAIPQPFRAAITDIDAAAQIIEAQAAIRTVRSTFENALLPLVRN